MTVGAQLGSQVWGPANGGKFWAFNNISTTFVQVLAANPFRQKITFVNPGTQTLYVCPLVNGAGVALSPTLSALGGCVPILPGALFPLDGECQVGWQVAAAAGSTNPLTIIESNVGSA